MRLRPLDLANQGRLNSLILQFLKLGVLPDVKGGNGNAAWLNAKNVQDFGACGDGVTDDYLSIQAAIDSLANGTGGVVTFPRTSYGYRFNTALEINKAGVHLLGETQGWRAYDGQDRGVPDLLYRGSGAALRLQGSGVSNVESGIIENLWLDGGGVGEYGIQVGRSGSGFKSYVGHVQNCTISGFALAGVRVMAAAGFTASQCIIERNAIGVLQEDTGANGEWNLSHCYIKKNTSQGVKLLGNSMLKLLNCVVESNNAEGLLWQSTALAGYLVLIGCDFENNCLTANDIYQVDLQAGSYANVLFLGNIFQDPNLAHSTGNKIFRIKAMSAEPSNSRLTFLGNAYNGFGIDKKGDVGSDGSHPINVMLVNETLDGWHLVTPASHVFTLHSGLLDSQQATPASGYIGLTLDPLTAGEIVSFGKSRTLMFNSGVQIMSNASKAGSAGYPAAAGSVGFHASPARGKVSHWSCVTGGAPTSTFEIVNASVAGWVTFDAPTCNVDHTLQIKCLGANNLTNFTNGTDGQHLVVLAASTGITLINGATLVTKTGADFPLANGAIAEFYYDATNTRWVQVN